MASEDVLHRYAAMLLSGGSSRQDDAAMMEALAAEVRELRGRLALFEELCGYMRGPIEVARKSLPLRVAGEPRNVDIYWRTSEDSLDLFDAAMGEERTDGE